MMVVGDSKLDRIEIRLRNRAFRIGRLIELRAPPILMAKELAKLQDQISKWHEEVLSSKINEIHTLNTHIFIRESAQDKIKPFEET
jgi:hypothetical protein